MSGDAAVFAVDHGNVHDEDEDCTGERNKRRVISAGQVSFRNPKPAVARREKTTNGCAYGMCLTTLLVQNKACTNSIIIQGTKSAVRLCLVGRAKIDGPGSLECKLNWSL